RCRTPRRNGGKSGRHHGNTHFRPESATPPTPPWSAGMHVQRPGVRYPAALVTVAVVMAAAGGCGQGGQARPTPEPGNPDPPAASWFRDVTDEAGVTAVYRNGEEADRYAILES